jgi:trimeric autotransporter adhesin
MKPKLVTFSILAALFLLYASGSAAAQSSGKAAAAPLGSAFTYQGRLSQGGSPASGAYDFQFYLFDSLSAGSQVGATIPVNDLALTDGYFTVSLDFGASIFTGQKRYLEVRVRPGSQTGSFTVLTPRQELTSSPSALFALSSPWSGLAGIPAGFADGMDNDTQYTAGTGLTLTSGQFSLTASYRLPQGCSTNQVPKWNGSAWICAADETGTGGSSWSLTGNAGTNPSTNYLGTSDNTAFVMRVNGQRALRLEPNAGGLPNVIGGYSSNTATAGAYSATIGGGGASGFANLVTDNGGTVCGGAGNRAGDNTGTTSDAESATVGGGYSNTASGYFSTVSGGYFNTASGSQAVVAGGGENQAQGNLSAIGGGAYNLTQADYATIGGGGPSDTANSTTTNNRVYDEYGTIGGGANNRAGSDDANTTTARWATIGGGDSNEATAVSATVGGGDTNYARGNQSTIGGGGSNMTSGDHGTIGGGSNNNADATYTTVGGGYHNIAVFGWATVAGGSSNYAAGGYATVGGGYQNSVNNQAATVAGGWMNVANGNASTVPGGANNEASGAYSFAAGADAHATQDGSFVWSSAARTDSWGVQTFTVRAPGGVRFYSAAGTTTGAVLPAGGGGFSSLSDRASKENFSPVNAEALLGKIASLPISSWNYKTQAESIRHIGPMAQDFHAAFGVGEDEKYISSIDADGVALAAIQGLYQQNRQQAGEIQSLKARLAILEVGGALRSSGAVSFLWGVVALLALSQVGMFVLLRRKAGRG